MTDFYSSNRFLFLSFAILIIGSVVFLISLFKERILSIKNSIQKETLAKNLINQDVKNEIFDISKVIPKKNIFNLAKEVSIKEALVWSKDAKITGYNFYLDKEYNETKLNIQIYFFSEWKKEKMTIYYPSLSTNYEKHDSFEKEVKKFFFEIPKWKQAISKAYEKNSSKISDQFSLQVVNYGDLLTLNFSFMAGYVKSKASFTFDGKKLFCKEDKVTIQI